MLLTNVLYIRAKQIFDMIYFINFDIEMSFTTKQAVQCENPHWLKIAMRLYFV
jgi:hypothetical protein